MDTSKGMTLIFGINIVLAFMMGSLIYTTTNLSADANQTGSNIIQAMNANNEVRLRANGYQKVHEDYGRGAIWVKPIKTPSTTRGQSSTDTWKIAREICLSLDDSHYTGARCDGPDIHALGRVNSIVEKYGLAKPKPIRQKKGYCICEDNTRVPLSPEPKP